MQQLLEHFSILQVFQVLEGRVYKVCAVFSAVLEAEEPPSFVKGVWVVEELVKPRRRAGSNPSWDAMFIRYLMRRISMSFGEVAKGQRNWGCRIATRRLARGGCGRVG